MDFVADALFDGRKLRMLTVVDCYTRECLAIEVVVLPLHSRTRPIRNVAPDVRGTTLLLQRLNSRGDLIFKLECGCTSLKCSKAAGELGQHRRRVAKVHPALVVAPEGVDEALGHAVALRAAHGRVDRRQPSDLAMRLVSCAM